jgi:glutaminyl-peptide cyclotransferase
MELNRLCTLILLFSSFSVWSQGLELQSTDFEGKRAWFHLEQLVSFGERYTGSPGSEQAKDYMRAVFQTCQGTLRESVGRMEVPGSDPIDIENIWYQFAPEVKEHRLLLGTHFDTRPWPDREEDESLHRVRGVIGACDGGSGTAILLELATLISDKNPNIPLDIVMFDAEEPLPKEFIPQGYFLGSRKFVSDRVQEGTLPQYGSVLVIDAVGGKGAKVGLEQSSLSRAPRWSGRIQGVLEGLDLPSLRAPANYSIWDDHTAFQSAGVPAALLIDYDYPYLDTLKDTLDKCDPQTLKEVGQVVFQVVIHHAASPMK